MKLTPEKIDTLIEKKSAEYETISRAVASLLESHEKERTRHAKELATMAETTEQELDKSLKDRKDQLYALLKEIKDADKQFTLVVKETEAVRLGALNDLERISREKATTEEIVGQLLAQKLSIDAELTVKSNELTDVITKLDKTNAEISEMSLLHVKKTDELSELQEIIFNAEMTFSAEKSGWEQEQLSANDMLSTTNARLDESTRKLNETQRLEESIREDLSVRTVSLDRREESLIEREGNIKIQENRLFNYSKFTKL